MRWKRRCKDKDEVERSFDTIKKPRIIAISKLIFQLRLSEEDVAKRQKEAKEEDYT